VAATSLSPAVDLETAAIAEHTAEQLVDALRMVVDGAKLARAALNDLLEQRETWNGASDKNGRELAMHLELTQAYLVLLDELETPRGAASSALGAAVDFFDHVADVRVDRRGMLTDSDA
jgi:hypothetical protein